MTDGECLLNSTGPFAVHLMSTDEEDFSGDYESPSESSHDGYLAYYDNPYTPSPAQEDEVPEERQDNIVAPDDGKVTLDDSRDNVTLTPGPLPQTGTQSLVHTHWKRA